MTTVFFQHTATEAEIEERRRLTFRELNLDEPKAEPEPAPSPGASKWKETDRPVLDYLQDIYDHPEMTTTQRDEFCGYSTEASKGFRAVLKDLGLADFETRRHGSRGRPSKMWFVTSKGLEALETNGRIKSEINRNKSAHLNRKN
jgi:hypothetical protein